MPTYEYRCKDCGEGLEVRQAFTDDALTECPACGGDLKKKFGAVGIAFKGSGFYKTDSRGSSSTSSSASTSSDGSGTDSATGTKDAAGDSGGTTTKTKGDSSGSDAAPASTPSSGASSSSDGKKAAVA